MMDPSKQEYNTSECLHGAQNDVEEEPLLSASNDERWTSRLTQSRWYGIFLYAALGLNLIILVVNWTLSQAMLNHAPDFYSPVHSVVEYVTTYVNYTHESIFAEEPGPAFDAAWHDLLLGSRIEVTAEETEAAKIKTLKLRGNDKYIAYLEVYHQLHCLKRLVQTRYRDRYADKFAQTVLTQPHFAHCVEVIRKGLMCNADTHLNPFAYDTTRVGNMASKSSGKRTCVRWDSITAWTLDRYAGLDFELDLEGEEDVRGGTY